MKAKAVSGSTLLALLLLLVACHREEVDSTSRSEEESAEILRERMVREVEARGVGDERVLDAMRAVPRHLFLPRDYRHLAYQQSPLPIGEEQTISSPYIVGRMSELLELDGSEKVLEIGTGSGYQAAVLAELVPKVYSIEIRPTLAEKARKRLARMGYDGVVVRCGDGYRGWPEEAPFDAIIVTAAPPEVPQALEEQLAVGGRMVVPVGRQDLYQTLTLIVKEEDGSVRREEKERVVFVPMVRSE